MVLAYYVRIEYYSKNFEYVMWMCGAHIRRNGGEVRYEYDYVMQYGLKS